MSYTEFDKTPLALNEAAVIYYLEHTVVDVATLDKLREMAHFNEAEIAEWLNVNVKTLRNYKSNHTVIKDHVQEKIVLLIALFNHGKAVFGSFEAFSDWLKKPNFFFDKKAPSSFLNTYSGTKFIDNRLTGMEFGDNV
ncbi:antitoxin Xre/MbcA/ParS toxin-binding domain-containing protein [Leeuwenhoekiella parthenopeia]|uniref:MbcA/ParS/Xre antitoxin family protein n=1 Tax=Leeuwenhoekiella parthenopeia TaxID=2890320 RepID=A0ABS8GVJ5_9FLAO|nr:antitoxin Xre/MbcA/ParS toxin-binding domain-containing protein [Leeuwenhoekiella parthenopeia]MCC4213836.1 MbcA/ParS/Xre antitoxin family protein [Leeuwenhoekiella parthenopeia]